MGMTYDELTAMCDRIEADWHKAMAQRDENWRLWQGCEKDLLILKAAAKDVVEDSETRLGEGLYVAPSWHTVKALRDAIRSTRGIGE